MVTLYKSHVLPYVEFSTPAIYHASNCTLSGVDRVLKRFVKAGGLTAEDALTVYNLAPLSSRRDMAMLGLIHRTVLKMGPCHFQEWFYLDTTEQHNHNTRLRSGRHTKQLHDYIDGTQSVMLKHSVLGLVLVYNKLPQHVVDAPTVSKFQKMLQHELKCKADKRVHNWANLYSSRQ